MKVLVTGGRTFKDTQFMIDSFASLDLSKDPVLICGMANGADMLAYRMWLHLGLPVIQCPAQWDLHGKAAGIIRNREMLKHEPDMVVAFWDGKSRGTQHMLQISEHITQHIFYYE